MNKKFKFKSPAVVGCLSRAEFKPINHMKTTHSLSTSSYVTNFTYFRATSGVISHFPCKGKYVNKLVKNVSTLNEAAI